MCKISKGASSYIGMGQKYATCGVAGQTTLCHATIDTVYMQHLDQVYLWLHGTGKTPDRSNVTSYSISIVCVPIAKYSVHG